MQPPHKDRLFELDRGDSSCPYSPRYLVHDQETFWAMNRGALRALTEDLGTSAQPTRKRHYSLLPRTSREAALGETRRWVMTNHLAVHYARRNRRYGERR